MKLEIYFDGVCNTCNSFVDFLLSKDPEDHFRFASLQSEYALKNLPRELTQTNKLDTIVVKYNGKIFIQSQAIIEISKKLNAPYAWLRFIKFIPRPIRDAGYKLFAKYRYKLFGKKETCRMPTPQEKQKFLI